MQDFLALKVDVPEAHFDRLASPVGTVVMITTVDREGRINAASFATCIRNHHIPTCFEFSVDIYKDTAANVVDTAEFVVNIPSFDREILEKVRVVGLPFAPGVNELEMAGLTAIPSKAVRPPRIGECKSHFECRVEWTKDWMGSRRTVVGRVVAASVNRDCIDANGFVLHDKLKPAHYAGHAYETDTTAKFVAAYEVMEVGMIYQGSEARLRTPVGGPPPRRGPLHAAVTQDRKVVS
jgi:flavin reductase (DIM6/NTAB) family NADH-FMN oxidoreductase RutF